MSKLDEINGGISVWRSSNSFPETPLPLTPSPRAQGACLEMVALSSSVKMRFCCLHSPGKPRTQWQRKTAQSWGLVYSCVGKKTADANEGWQFHEAQLDDGRFNVTGLNWAMIRTVCKIHFLAGLCPPAPSSKRSSPSPSSYAFECNKNWTRHRCAQFLSTTITFKKERKKNEVVDCFVTSSKWFFSHVDCKVSVLWRVWKHSESRRDESMISGAMCHCTDAVIHTNVLARDFGAAPQINKSTSVVTGTYFLFGTVCTCRTDRPLLPLIQSCLFMKLALSFIVLEEQHLHVPSGYGTLNNSPCFTRSMLSKSVGSREQDENQAFLLAL